MNRQEHLEWAKQRAREYLNRGDSVSAIASMASDLKKHEAWAGSDTLIGTLVMATAFEPDQMAAARRFVEGFN